MFLAALYWFRTRIISPCCNLFFFLLSRVTYFYETSVNHHTHTHTRGSLAGTRIDVFSQSVIVRWCPFPFRWPIAQRRQLREDPDEGPVQLNCPEKCIKTPTSPPAAVMLWYHVLDMTKPPRVCGSCAFGFVLYTCCTDGLPVFGIDNLLCCREGYRRTTVSDWLARSLVQLFVWVFFLERLKHIRKQCDMHGPQRRRRDGTLLKRALLLQGETDCVCASHNDHRLFMLRSCENRATIPRGRCVELGVWHGRRRAHRVQGLHVPVLCVATLSRCAK